MGQDRKWDKDRERARKAAYRERQKAIREAQAAKSAPEEKLAPLGLQPIPAEALLEPTDFPSLPDREQQIRDRFGYSATEKRTERERSDAAARMLKKDPQAYWDETHRNLPVGALRHPSWTEEQYVAHELSITKAQLAAGLKDPDGHTLERSERYLRWRYKGFVAGEIASL